MQHTNRSTFPLPLYSDTFNLLWYSWTRVIIFWYVSFCRAFVGALPVSISLSESIAFEPLPVAVLCSVSTCSQLPPEIFYLLNELNQSTKRGFFSIILNYSHQIRRIRWHNINRTHYVHYRWKLLLKNICFKFKYFEWISKYRLLSNCFDSKLKKNLTMKWVFSNKKNHSYTIDVIYSKKMLNKYCFHLFSFIFYLFGVGDCICWQLTGILNENVYTHTYALTCRLAWSWLHISSLFGITTRYLTAATWNNRQTSETEQCIVHIYIEVKWVNEQPNNRTNQRTNT